MNTTKLLFQFSIEVETSKAGRAVGAVLPFLAEFAAITLPRNFPSFSGKVELLPVREIKEDRKEIQ